MAKSLWKCAMQVNSHPLDRTCDVACIVRTGGEQWIASLISLAKAFYKGEPQRDGNSSFKCPPHVYILEAPTLYVLEAPSYLKEHLHFNSL